MWNGFDLPENVLKEHLQFIREEIGRINGQMTKINNLKGYEKKSDDAETLMGGYQKIQTELNALLRHEYDAEK